MTDPGLATAAADAFAALLEDTHLSQPDLVADLVAEHAGPLGLEDVVLHLVDYEQTTLVPVPRRREPVDRPVLRIDGTVGGRAFAETTMYEVDAGQDGRRRLWLPLIDGTDRLGVMELTAPAPVTDQLLIYCERYAHLIAQLVVSKNLYGDAFELVRRRRPMTVAAELQWTLLPPLVFATRGLVVAGALEPCYTVGGDSFDYAVDESTAQLAVFDAMGHGLTAAATAAVTISAYRNARRQLLDLPGTYAAVDQTVRGEFGGERFATGVLARLDLSHGLLRWINAGHPPPLLLRGGKLVKVLELRPTTPLGVPFGQAPVLLGEEQLEPGDRVLLYTDGVTEARTPSGEFFTADRLAEFLEREAAEGRPTPETLRRLRHAILAHQHGQLQDDATALLVEWRRDTELALLPDTVAP
jgi:hypothetical protein